MSDREGKKAVGGKQTLPVVACKPLAETSLLPNAVVADKVSLFPDAVVVVKVSSVLPSSVPVALPEDSSEQVAGPTCYEGDAASGPCSPVRQRLPPAWLPEELAAKVATPADQLKEVLDEVTPLLLRAKHLVGDLAPPASARKETGAPCGLVGYAKATDALLTDLAHVPTLRASRPVEASDPDEVMDAKSSLSLA